MSILSMTGFGRSRVELCGVEYAIEIRAINHRFLDLKLHLPRLLSTVEPLVRARIASQIARGHVDVTIQATSTDAVEATEVRLNAPLAHSLLSAMRQMASELSFNLDESRLLDRIACWPGVLAPCVPEFDVEAQGEKLNAGIDAAIEQMRQMRKAEGLQLEKALTAILDRIESLRQVCEQHAAEQNEIWRQKLEDRLRTHLAHLGTPIDEGRLLQEVALIAERSDIAEEIARLESHVLQGRTLLQSDAPEGVGRQLDFLCQEMLREVNTTASKVQDLRLSSVTLELKAELERFREQIQNVE